MVMWSSPVKGFMGDPYLPHLRRQLGALVCTPQGRKPSDSRQSGGSVHGPPGSLCTTRILAIWGSEQGRQLDMIKELNDTHHVQQTLRFEHELHCFNRTEGPGSFREPRRHEAVILLQ